MAKDSFNEKDWKIYRSKIAGWQESYMERLTKEYIELLSGDAAASDKFWELEKRIKVDKKRVGVSVHLSRSEMEYQIMELLNDGAIQMSDLAEFSEDLQEKMKFFKERWS